MGDPVLGLLADATYTTESAQLENGDVLVLYKDGVVEAESPKGEFYSIEHLQSITLALADQPADRIAEAIYKSVRIFRRVACLR